MRYAIIGNSAAAVGCIEGIRQMDRTGGIIVISDESHHTYSRPLISYFLLGRIDMDGMKYRGDDFYKDNGCETVFGSAAIKICPDTYETVLENGRNIRYDKLLVATGSRPFIPPVSGLEKVRNRFTFMSLDDAVLIKKAITDKSRVLVIGAGLIGLKCAESILPKTGAVTVTDTAERILPSILDAGCSALMRDHLENHGVTFILGDAICSLCEGRAIFKSGRSADFDILVIAAGVRPNASLVAEAGGTVGKGIIINEKCETDIENVYAAGDCCESYDVSCGVNRPLAILPNAYMQGSCAGRNMSGGHASFRNAIPMNSLSLAGLHVITAGSYEGDSYIRNSGTDYKALFYKDGLLKGFILSGNVGRAGIYTSLIREQTPLCTIDFELICEKPQLMAFARNARADLLGKEQ